MTFDPSRVKYVLFDHDGVLVDTEQLYFRATQRALAEIGVDLSLEAYRRHLVDGSGSFEHARHAGHDDAAIEAARTRRNRYYQAYLVEEDIDIPGVESVLTRLGERFDMAIVTTAKREDFELIHRDRNIVPFMAFVLCNGDYLRAKPHPDPYLAALEKFGAAPEEALVVEDSARGLQAAVAAGIPCVTVRHEFTAHQDLSAAHRQVASLEELAALLLG